MLDGRGPGECRGVRSGFGRAPSALGFGGFMYGFAPFLFRPPRLPPFAFHPRAFSPSAYALQSTPVRRQLQLKRELSLEETVATVAKLVPVETSHLRLASSGKVKGAESSPLA